VPVLMCNGDGEDEAVLSSHEAEACGFVCRTLPTGGHAATFAAAEACCDVVEPFLAASEPTVDDGT
jgi:hypothetical protein